MALADMWTPRLRSLSGAITRSMELCMPAPVLTNCAACPHQIDCQRVGSCLDEINAA